VLNDDQKYKKFTWIIVNVEKTKKEQDFRPESYRPFELESLQTEESPHFSKTPWELRKSIIFKKEKAYTNKEKLLAEARACKRSLAIFKPSKIIDFKSEKSETEWPKEKMEALKRESMQQSLFKSREEVLAEFKAVPKVPYDFYYIFEDDAGARSKMVIKDWEIGMLYFNCLKNAHGNENVAVDMVRKKYFCEFTKRDLYLFLGTTLEFQKKSAPNPFMIIGVFAPPHPKGTDSNFRQRELF
jgi:hypothetical protein